MTTERTLVSVGVAAFMLACAPPGVGADETGEDSTSGDSSTSESETETETGEATSASMSFIPPDDLACLCTCDIFAQDCPEGEKCVPYSSVGGIWDAHKCVPVLGDQGEGEPCTYDNAEATDNCDATTMCWDVMFVDGEVVGTCRTFCGGSLQLPECPVSTQCLVSGDGIIAFCIPNCDPIAQDCGPGLGCFWTGDDFTCVFTTEDVPPGQACELLNQCVAGAGCVSGDLIPGCAGESCCAAFCELGLGDAQCDAVPGTMCEPFFAEGMAPPGYEQVGACVSI